MKRAYRATAYGTSGIIAAETAGQAKFRVFRTLQDTFAAKSPSDVKVRRAPEHDDWAAVDSTGVCWQESLLPATKRQGELI